MTRALLRDGPPAGGTLTVAPSHPLHPSILAVLEAQVDPQLLVAPDASIRWASASARRAFSDGADPAGRDLFEVLAAEGVESLREALGEVSRGRAPGWRSLWGAPLRSAGACWQASLIPIGTPVGDLLLCLDEIAHPAQGPPGGDHPRALELIGRMASGIAHEINNPAQFIGDNLRFVATSAAGLTAVIEAWRSGSETPEGRAAARLREVEVDAAFLLQELPVALADALEGVEAISRIVRGMRMLGRGAADEVARPEDLHPIVESVLTVAAHEIKYVADVVRDYGQLPPVPCVRGELGQVLLNLVTNAAQAIRARGDQERRGTLTLTTRTCGPWAVIGVHDDGVGVPDALLERIFEPFFTTKAVGEGTGQGLAISRALVERHGGRLDVASEVGRGTTFRVRLPLALP